MGGQIQYVYWDGARLTPWMKYQLERLDADLRRIFGVHLIWDSSKGIRLNEEQRRIFLDRYRPQASGRGPYGDVRYWNGVRYVRHSGLGTVAQPGSSNHEIQGDKAAVDLADSGGPGVAAWGSERSNWLRANAHHYGLIPEGFNFGEAWHYAMPGILRTPPTTAGNNVTPPVTEEDDMLALRIDGVHKCALGIGTFSHMIGTDNPDRIKDIVRSDDKYTEITLSELPVLLRRYGCDLHIWDIRGGQFVVLDPLDGSVKPGNVWTATNAARSTIAAVKVTSEVTRKYVEALTS